MKLQLQVALLLVTGEALGFGEVALRTMAA
jgi:hypothetical protein